jgi:hypothetical protein
LDRFNQNILHRISAILNSPTLQHYSFSHP